MSRAVFECVGKAVARTDALYVAEEGGFGDVAQEVDIGFLVAHGRVGVVEIFFGGRGDEAEGFGVGSRTADEGGDGAVGFIGGRHGEDGGEVGKVLLDEGCVEAEGAVGEVHCVPVVGDNIGRPLLDRLQRVRDIGHGELSSVYTFLFPVTGAIIIRNFIPLSATKQTQGDKN